MFSDLEFFYYFFTFFRYKKKLINFLLLLRFLDFLDFVWIIWDFWIFFYKVNMATTKSRWGYLWTSKAKLSSDGGRSTAQELEVSPQSGLLLLVLKTSKYLSFTFLSLALLPVWLQEWLWCQFYFRSRGISFCIIGGAVLTGKIICTELCKL